MTDRIASAAGIDQESAVRLQILASAIKALFGLRRQAALDFQSPEAMPRYLQNEVDLRACRGAIEAGYRAGGGRGYEVFDIERS